MSKGQDVGAKVRTQGARVGPASALVGTGCNYNHHYQRPCRFDPTQHDATISAELKISLKNFKGFGNVQKA